MSKYLFFQIMFYRKPKKGFVITKRFSGFYEKNIVIACERQKNMRATQAKEKIHYLDLFLFFIK